MVKARISDEELTEQLIRQRQRLGIDLYDEVWEGVYVRPSMPRTSHQKLVHDLETVLDSIIVQESRGDVYPGLNVSDRRENWKENFRVPDVVVVLQGSKAEDCGTHFFGGPDFLVEIESPGDDTEEKLPFYSKLQVRELLIVHRDSRALRLFRFDKRNLVMAGQSTAEASAWITSDVIPLAFRWKSSAAGPRTELKRTDGKRKSWII